MIHTSATLEAITDWAKAHQDIRGLALVGSHTRKEARADSDIDLVFLTTNPANFRGASSLTTIDWPEASVHPTGWADEEYGVVWSRRVWLTTECEIEFTFAPLSWADVSPIDKGTARVVSNACRILYDPAGLLNRLTLAVARLK